MKVDMMVVSRSAKERRNIIAFSRSERRPSSRDRPLVPTFTARLCRVMIEKWSRACEGAVGRHSIVRVNRNESTSKLVSLCWIRTT